MEPDAFPNFDLLLMEVRKSIETHDRRENAILGKNDSEFLSAILAIEEARVLLRRMHRRQHDLREINILSDEVVVELVDRFVGIREFGSDVLEIPFRYSNVSSEEDSEGRKLPRRFVHERYRNAKYLSGVFERLASEFDANLNVTANREWRRLGSIIPEQSIAPAQFEVHDGRIRLLKEQPLVDPNDSENVNSAMDYLREAGADLIQNLEQSNCDPRILENVKYLHTQINNNENIVKIGLSNIACSMVCSHFQEELPNAINGLFNAYNTNISLYVSQFPEWQKFVEKAASVNLTEKAIKEIDATSKAVVDYLEANPNLAENEVPETIRALRSFLIDPRKATQQAAFAILRTIENLGAGVLKFVQAVVVKTGEKTIDKLAGAAAASIVGLLTLALVSVSGLSTAAVQASSPWINQAAEIVKREIELLAPPTAPPP